VTVTLDPLGYEPPPVVVPEVRGDALVVTEKLAASPGRTTAKSDNATSNCRKFFFMGFLFASEF
jgi:hypothetical protein